MGSAGGAGEGASTAVIEAGNCLSGWPLGDLRCRGSSILIAFASRYQEMAGSCDAKEVSTK